MTRNRSAPLLRLLWYMLTLAAPGSHRKLGGNGVSSCEKAEQPRQTGEGGAGGRISRIYRTGAPDNSRKPGWPKQAGQCSSWRWWADRRRCSLKGMELGTRQQCAPECVQSPALGLTSRLKPGQEQPYFPQRLEADKAGRSGLLRLILFGFHTRKCNSGRI